jgi:glycosyltransferase involved in cell wall biosynthesis
MDQVTSDRPLVRFLCHGAERSGPPIYLLRLLNWWATHDPGFAVEVILARPGVLVPQYRAVAPTAVVRLDRRSPERLAERALSAVGGGGLGHAVVDGAIRRRSKRGVPAVTVVNGATAATARMLGALDPGGTILVIAHELSTGWFHNIDAAGRNRLLTADRFLAVSRGVKEFLVDQLGVDPVVVAVAPPAVEVGRVAPGDAGRVETGQLTVGGGGFTDWRKAPELWLRVAYEVRRLVPKLPVRFVWFGGDAPGSDAFWPLAHEMRHLGLNGAVEFLGPVDEPQRVLDGLDLFVSTAREDAYPLVCAEAAASAVPVVAFNDGGAAELINDGGCGEVAEYPDVVGMAQRVASLLADRPRRVELGANGRKFALEQLEVSMVAPRVADWVLSGATS